MPRSPAMCTRSTPAPANRSRHSATAGASICTRISDAIPSGSQSRSHRPGVVHKDLLILGGRVSEGLPASPGDIRAYNARTGALQWSFHTIPHPGEAGLRDVVEGVVARERRREQLAGHGARRGARDRLRPDGFRRGRFLRRQPRRRQPLRELPARAQRRHRKAPLALPVRAARHLGSRCAGAAEPHHDHGGTARRSTRSRRPPSTGTSSCSIA